MANAIRGFIVVCGPYYVPQNDLGFYPKVLLPDGLRRRPRTERIEKTTAHGGHGGGGAAGYEMMMQAGDNNEGLMNSSSIDCHQETLALFPLHPTGDLQRRPPPITPPHPEISAENSTTLPTSSESATTPVIEDGSCDQPFFDFFSAPSSRGI